MPRASVLLLSFFFLFIHAAVIIVDESTDYVINSSFKPGLGCSLRGAIVNSNRNQQYDPNCPAGSGTDTIVLQVDFTFNLANSGPDNNAFTGDLDILESLVIVGNFHTINAASLDRVFEIRNDAAFEISNVTLINGFDNGAFGQRNLAAGILCFNAQPLIVTNLIISDCVVDITSISSSVAAGAGILTTSRITANGIKVTNCEVRGGIRSGSAISAGIGIINQSNIPATITLNNLEFNDNTVLDITSNFAGTAGIGLFGEISFTGSLKGQGNSAPTGGLFFIQSTQPASIRLTGNITDNTARTGGAFFRDGGGRLEINFMLFSALNNEATNFGGLIFTSGICIISNFTEISGNNALNGGVVASLSEVYFFEGLRISDNKASNEREDDGIGGVVIATDADIFFVAVEEIVDNAAGLRGGVVFLLNDRNIEEPYLYGVYFTNVTHLSRNKALQDQISAGGVVYASNTDVTFQHVENIDDNGAYFGGVIYSLNNPEQHTIRINNVTNIRRNSATSNTGAGSIVWATRADVILSNVTGTIDGNEALFGDGTLIYVDKGSGLIEDITGSIINQFGFDGGLMSVSGPSGSTGTLRNIYGPIANNTGYFLGGLIYCGEQTNCIMENIFSEIYNSSCGSGCLMYSENLATLSNVLGDITKNVAIFDGSLIVADEIVVASISGVIADNLVEQGSAAFYSLGSININGAAGFFNNIANSQGAVAHAVMGSITMENICEFSGNRVIEGQAHLAFAGTGDISISTSAIDDQSGIIADGEVIVTLFERLTSSFEIINSTPNSYVGEASGFSGVAPYTYHWDNGDRTQVSSNIRTSNPFVDVRDAAFCTARATVIIPPPVANPGVSTYQCPEISFVLGGNPSGRAGTTDVSGPVSYLWGPISAISSNRNISNPSVRITATTEFTLTVTDVATGLQDTKSVLMSVPRIDVNAGDRLSVCQGESLLLGSSPTATVDFGLTLTYIWRPSLALSDSTVANPSASPTSSINYEVIVSTEECTSLRAVDTVYVEVVANSPPTAVANPQTNVKSYFICRGSSIELGGTSSGYPEPLSYLWTPSEGLDNPTSPHPIASPQTTTTYTLQVSTFGSCNVARDNVTVRVNDLVVNAGRDIINSGSIGGSPSASGGTGPYNYQWSPSTALSSPTIANPFAAPTRSTSYRLTVRDSNQCTITSSSVVNVVVRREDTSGLLQMSYSYIPPAVPFPNIDDAKADLNRIISTLLDIPPLAVEVKTLLFDTTTKIYTANVFLYEFELTGTQLALIFRGLFACSNSLPCTANPTLPIMLQIGFNYLEFLAPAGNENSDFSFSDNNLFTLSFPTVEPSTETEEPFPPRYDSGILPTYIVVVDVSNTSQLSPHWMLFSILLTIGLLLVPLYR